MRIHKARVHTAHDNIKTHNQTKTQAVCMKACGQCKHEAHVREHNNRWQNPDRSVFSYAKLTIQKSSISWWHYSERSHLMVSGAVVRCVNCKKFSVARCKDFWEKGQIFKILFINKFCGRRRGISIRQKEEKFYRGVTQNCYLNSSGFTNFH